MRNLWALLEADPTKSMVTKIAAAERLIGTAVRMVFQDCDEFSICEIALAAHGALQAVKSTRDQTQLRDPVMRGVACLARECRTGSPLPDEITGTCLEEIVAKVSRLDKLEKLDQLPRHQSHFWAQFERPYHQIGADVISAANEQPQILSAGAIYVELLGRQTVELDAYEMYIFGGHQLLSPLSFDPELMAAFAELQPERKRALCMDLLRQAKKDQALSTDLLIPNTVGRRR